MRDKNESPTKLVLLAWRSWPGSITGLVKLPAAALMPDQTFFHACAEYLLRWYSQLPTGDGRASADRRGRRVAVQGFAALRAAPERRLVTRGSAETALGGPRRRRGAARCPRSFSLHGRRRSSCTTADARAAAGAARTVFPGLAEVPGRSEAPDRGDRVD